MKENNALTQANDGESVSAGTGLEPLNVGGDTFTDLKTDVENSGKLIKIHYRYNKVMTALLAL